MNSFGNGIVLPFLVIYLHDVRGFRLGVAGLVVGDLRRPRSSSPGFVAGPLVDRLGPRRVLGGGLVHAGRRRSASSRSSASRGRRSC